MAEMVLHIVYGAVVIDEVPEPATGIPAADTRPWSGGHLAFGATMRSYSKDWIDPSESRRPCGRTTARRTIARYGRIYENHSMECPG